jgi:Flp pilus assembly pilin Flp
MRTLIVRFVTDRSGAAPLDFLLYGLLASAAAIALLRGLLWRTREVAALPVL